MNAIPITIFNSNFGTMEPEDGGSPMQWANCQTIGDYQENGDKVGCQIGKMSVNIDNHFALSKRLNAELREAKGPIEVMAQVGMGVSNGKSTFILKDFEIVK
ncbi:hypothetical protein [Vibrio parahaemolyticus]|uniref:hypothetical protein n=1 Tax=Vibrio parahaemolyticus TaxID=670 RepID=UPI0007A07F8C|nr:hypothetical protein [Vibrio parahaemolyticus]ELE6596800.1 hypothetical protein [Vibrio alginolyticus]KYX82282.1 hypothetical protein AVP39_17230 [Vibrio parahaemolyticus]KYX82291.1 hypothetical protein AVP39_17280 [Vibrio parahaemolyticus]HCZ9266413.1 hypothetical protein [Vibrio alginolyticus]